VVWVITVESGMCHIACLCLQSEVAKVVEKVCDIASPGIKFEVKLWSMALKKSCPLLLLIPLPLPLFSLFLVQEFHFCVWSRTDTAFV